MTAVSVVIPSYNHEKYIAQAVQSILNQSESDLELIVIDDGSSDRSLEILNGFKDSRLTVISQENQGAHAAINRGLGAAKGQYLAILNSDDVFHPKRLEYLTRALSRHPEVGLIGSYLQVIDTVGNSLGIKHGYRDLNPWALTNPEWSFRQGEDLRVVQLAENYWSTTSNFVFTREWYDRVGPFRPLRYVHDWDFALRIGQKAKLLMIPEPLISYRIHSSNTIKINRPAMIYEICWILAVHLPQALRTEWFQVKDQFLRSDQLLHSIYMYGCDRILTLMLLLSISEKPETALEILRPDHPFRNSCLKYIQKHMAEVSETRPAQLSGKNIVSSLKDWIVYKGNRS
jgi:glycosyltransferase involved in cell wall biosynthesis